MPIRWLIVNNFRFKVIVFVAVFCLFPITSFSRQIPKFSIYTLDNVKVTNANFDQKPVIIHFWSHHCDVCIKELEALNDLYDKFGNDLSFIIIHDGYSKYLVNRVKQVMKKKHIKYSMFLADASVGDAFNITMVPYTFLVDKNGKIVESITGLGEWKSGKMQKMIRKLIRK